MHACRWLQQRGWDVTYLPVRSDGMVDMAQLADAIRPDTALVSIMAINNEIGTCTTNQPIHQSASGWCVLCMP